MWEKRATSTECKTIRIVESSVMDSWKALLRPMCKVLRFKKINGDVLCNHAKGSAWGCWNKRKTIKGYGREGRVLRKNMFWCIWENYLPKRFCFQQRYRDAISIKEKYFPKGFVFNKDSEMLYLQEKNYISKCFVFQQGYRGATYIHRKQLLSKIICFEQRYRKFSKNKVFIK